MAEQQQSIKVIIDKIMRHPLLQDASLETIIDYSIDFMRIVGVPSIFEEKTASLEVLNYRVNLPSDYYQMNQVRGVNENGDAAVTFTYATNTFHMSETKPVSTDCTYKIQGGVIYTSIVEGEIEISYQAISLDEDGYPLIPDNSSVTVLSVLDRISKRRSPAYNPESKPGHLSLK